MNEDAGFPKTYVLILNYNGWQDTLECLESVLRNTYSNYRVILCDNASKNRDLEHIEAWAEGRLEVALESFNPLRYLSFPPVPKPLSYVKLEQSQLQTEEYWDGGDVPLILLQMEENLGFAGGNNAGINLALTLGADYIWLLNNDTVMDEAALTEMVKLAESDDKIAMVGSRILYYHQPDVIQALAGSDKMSWRGAGHLVQHLAKDKPEFDKSLELKGFIHGSCLLVKRKVIDKIGLLDPNFFMWKEEEDWCLRALRNGWTFYYCGKSKIWHKAGASTGTHVTKKMLGKKSNRDSLGRFVITGYYDVRNRIYFANKNFKSYSICNIFYLSIYVIWKISSIILYNDDQKLIRFKLIMKGVYDGLKGNLGKTISPEDVMP